MRTAGSGGHPFTRPAARLQIWALLQWSTDAASAMVSKSKVELSSGITLRMPVPLSALTASRPVNSQHVPSCEPPIAGAALLEMTPLKKVPQTGQQPRTLRRHIICGHLVPARDVAPLALKPLLTICAMCQRRLKIPHFAGRKFPTPEASGQSPEAVFPIAPFPSS